LHEEYLIRVLWGAVMEHPARCIRTNGDLVFVEGMGGTCRTSVCLTSHWPAGARGRIGILYTDGVVCGGGWPGDAPHRAARQKEEQGRGPERGRRNVQAFEQGSTFVRTSTPHRGISLGIPFSILKVAVVTSCVSERVSTPWRFF